MHKNFQKAGGQPKKHKKIKIQDYYVLGQNVARSSILECVDLLLERDYPEIVAFDGSKNGMVGSIFIPEGYLPKKPKVIDSEKAEVVMEQNPDDKNLIGDVRQSKGDMLERHVYDSLKKHFSSKADENHLRVVHFFVTWGSQVFLP